MKTRLLAALALVCIASIPAHAADPPKLPPGVTCEQIAQLYAEWSHVGKRVMRGWLFINGYSRAQMREAERCLR